MRTFPALVAVGTSVWLLDHALGFRTDSPGAGLAPVVDPRDKAADSTDALCDYSGPDGGPAFNFREKLRVPKARCDFTCKSRLIEFEDVQVKKIFAHEFMRTSSYKYCKCTAFSGEPKTLITFKDNKAENCNPQMCWRKYLLALNYEQTIELKKDTMKAKCVECKPGEACEDYNGLESFDDVAKHVLEEAGGSEKLDALMRREGLIRTSVVGLDAAEGFSFQTKALEFKELGPCDPKMGPFPRQCVVEPGPIGDEWKCQLYLQGCAGNQFIVQKQDGMAVAITVFSVQNLISEETVQGYPFTETFTVTMQDDGGVSIGLGELPLDYAAHGADSQLVLENTKRLTLSGDDGQVALMQVKGDGTSNVARVTALEPSMLAADGCAPNTITLEGQVSNRPPYQMP